MAALEPLRCAACGGPLGTGSVRASIAPDGKTIWYLHTTLAECVQATKKARPTCPTR